MDDDEEAMDRDANMAREAVSTPAHQLPPLSWLAEESFWRSVSINTISGLLVATILYVFGVALGYFGGPFPTQDRTRELQDRLAVFAFTMLTLVYAAEGARVMLNFTAAKMGQYAKSLRTRALVLAAGGYVALLVIVWLLLYVVMPWVSPVAP